MIINKTGSDQSPNPYSRLTCGQLFCVHKMLDGHTMERGGGLRGEGANECARNKGN